MCATGFWCISHTYGWSCVRQLELGTHRPNPHSVPQHVCHCCSVPKACLSQTFSLGEMFTIHIKGEKQQGHCLKSEVQSKGRAPLVVKLWSALEKSVCLLFQLMSHIRRSVLCGFCQDQHAATYFSVPAFLIPLKRWSPSATKHLNICSTLMEVFCWATTFAFNSACLSASSLWSFKGTRRDAQWHKEDQLILSFISLFGSSM